MPLPLATAATIRLAHVDGADWQNSKKGAAGVIFKNIVEGVTTLKVDLYPAGSLGGEDALVQQAREGVTQVVLVSGAMSKICKPAQVLDIPYTFSSAPMAWDVLDGKFGKELAEFRKLSQPAVKQWLAGELGDEASWIEKLDAAVKAASGN